MHPQGSTEREWQIAKPKHHPAPVPPRPIPGAISPWQDHLCMPRGEQGAPGQVGTQSKDSEEGTPLSRASWDCPRRGFTPTSQYNDGPQRAKRTSSRSPSRPSMGHVMWCQGRAFWDCTRFIMECLGKKSEVGKGIDLDDLGRNNCEKIEV